MSWHTEATAIRADGLGCCRGASGASAKQSDEVVWLLSVRRCHVLGCSGMASAQPQPQPWKTTEAASIDDPVVALQIAQGALQRASRDHDVDAEFWALLAQARVLISLEDSERRQAVLTQARGKLDQLHGNVSQAQLWLDIVQALSDVRETPIASWWRGLKRCANGPARWAATICCAK